MLPSFLRTFRAHGGLSQRELQRAGPAEAELGSPMPSLVLPSCLLDFVCTAASSTQKDGRGTGVDLCVLWGAEE